jgi:hypothetical protein
VFAEMQVPSSKELSENASPPNCQIKISIVGRKSGYTMKLALAEGKTENRV